MSSGQVSEGGQESHALFLEWLHRAVADVCVIEWLAQDWHLRPQLHLCVDKGRLVCFR